MLDARSKVEANPIGQRTFADRVLEKSIELFVRKHQTGTIAVVEKRLAVTFKIPERSLRVTEVHAAERWNVPGQPAIAIENLVLERKLKLAQMALLDVKKWAIHSKDKGMAGGFAIVNSALRELGVKSD